MRGRGPVFDVVKPGFLAVLTPWDPGFTASGRTRDAQVAVLAVPAGRLLVSLS